MFGSGIVLLWKDGIDNEIFQTPNVKQQIQPILFLAGTIIS